MIYAMLCQNTTLRFFLKSKKVNGVRFRVGGLCHFLHFRFILMLIVYNLYRAQLPELCVPIGDTRRLRVTQRSSFLEK